MNKIKTFLTTIDNVCYTVGIQNIVMVLGYLFT